MLSDDIFGKMQETCNTWLNEFSTSDKVTNFSKYQIENIGTMFGTLLLFSKKEEVSIENWTPEIVVELILDYCKMSPEEPRYFDILPETLASFFNFLEEKEYLPNGKAISNAILAAKKDIHQTEEESMKLSLMHELMQEALDEGIDVKDTDAMKAFFAQKLQEKKVLNEFRAKLDSGIPISKVMDTLSKAELDIVMRDINKEAKIDSINEEKAKAGIEILKKVMANGKSIEEAIASLPKEYMTDVLGYIQSNPDEMSMFVNAPMGNYRPSIEPVQRDKKIGRNEPCPCGSRKKYKRCCLKK